MISKYRKFFPLGRKVNGYQAWLAILLVAYGGGSASQDTSNDRPHSVSYCDLFFVPQKYDKEIVTTEALIRSNDHEVLVFDYKCRSTATNNRSTSMELSKGWDSTKLGKKLSKILRHGQTARVAFESTFYDAGGPYGPEHTRFHFVMKQLISVDEDSTIP